MKFSLLIMPLIVFVSSFASAEQFVCTSSKPSDDVLARITVVDPCQTAGASSCRPNVFVTDVNGGSISNIKVFNVKTESVTDLGSYFGAIPGKLDRILSMAAVKGIHRADIGGARIYSFTVQTSAVAILQLVEFYSTSGRYLGQILLNGSPVLCNE